LTRGDSILVPGGWNDSHGGHAIIYSFCKDENGNIRFSINNSGAGLQYHPKRSESDKELYCPIKEYLIPRNSRGDRKGFANFIYSLLVQRAQKLRDKSVVTAEYLYCDVISKISFLDAHALAPPERMEDYCYTGGQLSGTCSQRSIHQMLKARFSSLDSYRRFIYGFKHFALRHYIERLQKEGALSDVQKHGPIEKAIRHNLRLLLLKSDSDSAAYLFDEQQRINDMRRLKGYLALLKQKAKASEKDMSMKEAPVFEHKHFQGSPISQWVFEAQPIKQAHTTVTQAPIEIRGGGTPTRGVKSPRGKMYRLESGQTLPPAQPAIRAFIS